jgi:hypothetical protein
MLDHKVALYVPSTINGNQPAPAEQIARWVKASKIKLASLFGGFTAYQDVTIVQAYTDEDGLAKIGQLRELAAAIARDMGQEVVSLEVNGTLNFVSA